MVMIYNKEISLTGKTTVRRITEDHYYSRTFVVDDGLSGYRITGWMIGRVGWERLGGRNVRFLITSITFDPEYWAQRKL
jgi:hypothetical protein